MIRVDSKVLLEDGINSFRLSVSLGVEGSRKVEIRTQEFAKSLLEDRSEQGATVADD